jgi:FAD synthetase
MAFGTFDFFHEGHEHYLKNAKALGDHLIVVVSRDRTVKQTKGEYPVHNEKKRAEVIRKTGLADKVILGHHGDKYKVLRKYRPDILALGYDQFIFTQKLNKTLIDLQLDAVITRLDAFFPQVYKSSLIKRELQFKAPEPIKTSETHA